MTAWQGERAKEMRRTDLMQMTRAELLESLFEILLELDADLTVEESKLTATFPAPIIDVSEVLDAMKNSKRLVIE